MQYVAEYAQDFDILHFHTDYLHFPLSVMLNIPHVTTLHGRLDIPDLQDIYKIFKTQPLISISDAQRKPLPYANWIGTVYHGLPLDLYQKREGDGDYVAFIGRISPEKRPDRAIEIAKEVGVKIKIAAKVDKADEEYYQRHIKELLEQPHVEFIGEIGEDQKNEFLGKAKALLFPVDWPEPFGMVMIEAMACGTPIIAFNNGSVPETLGKGEAGHIVDNIEEAAEMLEKVGIFSRSNIRQVFETCFSAKRMADDYIKIFEKLTNKKKQQYSFQLNNNENGNAINNSQTSFHLDYPSKDFKNP